MKTIIAILMCISLAACYRAHNEPLPDVSAVFNIMAGSKNLKDGGLSYNVYDSANLQIPLSFGLLSGNPENYPISCSISNLPQGITASQDSFSFKLNMQITFVLAVAIDTGIYPVNINVRTRDGLNTYPISIHVAAVRDCAPTLAGSYTGRDPGNGPGGSVWHDYTALVSTVPNYPHLLSIQNIHGLGDSITITAAINCNGTFDIPLQTTKGYTFFGRGKGHWEASGLNSYGDTVVYNGDTTVWWAQLVR